MYNCVDAGSTSPLDVTLSPEGESGEDFIMRNISPKKCRKDIFVVNKSISWGCFSIFTITISASMYNSMAEIVDVIC